MMDDRYGIDDLMARVIEPGLCAQCGLCVAICPTHAIRLVESRTDYDWSVTSAAPEQCTHCGLCYDVCPGRAFDRTHISTALFGIPEAPPVGNFVYAFVGQASCSEIRQRSASGGVVTALLSHALDEGWVDGALAVGCLEEKPWVPVARMATSAEEALGMAGSKYTVVPLLEGLRILEGQNGQFALVGLPCHIYGVRKLMAKLPHWQKKISCCIGLYCGWNRSVQGFEFLMRRTGFRDLTEVKEFEYRTRRGDLSIVTADGKEERFRRGQWLFLDVFFSPKRCLLCDDLCNEMADVSVGDVWLEKWRDDGQHSLVIVRTDVGQQYVERAIAEGALVNVAQLDRRDLVQSHRSELAFKRQGAPMRSVLLDPSVMPSSERGWAVKGFLVQAIYLLFAGLWRRRWGRLILSVAPIPILRTCAKALLRLQGSLTDVAYENGARYPFGTD